MKWNDRQKAFFGSLLVQLGCRFALGAIFIYAAISKIRDPAAFASQMAAYRILPPSLVSLAALALPWIELLCGLLLIGGPFVHSSAWLLSILLFFFMGASVFNLLRGVVIDCGCFGVGGQPEPPLLIIFRDVLFLLLALPILFHGGEKAPPEDRSS